MEDAFIGEIRIFAGNFDPRDWEFCDGRLLNITDNTALFSILGTTYGGDGITNFALPDLRGRTPVHFGQSTNYTYTLGQKYGADKIELKGENLPAINIPAHSHAVAIPQTNIDASLFAMSGSVSHEVAPGANIMLGVDSLGPAEIYAKENVGTKTIMSTQSIIATLPSINIATSVAGATNTSSGNSPVDVRQPSLALNYIICKMGNYPSRKNRRIMPEDKKKYYKSPKIFTGIQEIGSSDTKKKTVTVTHNLRLLNCTKFVSVSITNSGDYQDVFSATVINNTIDADQFAVVIARIDGESWGQNPSLIWTILSEPIED